MEYKFEVKYEEAKPVLSMRTRTAVGDLPQKLGQAYTKIVEYVQEIGVEGLELAFAAYYNMDMENLDVEMGFLLSKRLPGKGDIVANELPAGKQATYLYKGPYAEMAPVYDAMARWLDSEGHSTTGVCYEYYFNSPLEVPESELLTRIVMPLK